MLLIDRQAWYASALALIAGFAFDMIAGDPEWFPHPVRGMGFLIGKAEKIYRTFYGVKERAAGTALVITIAFISFDIPLILIAGLWRVHKIVGFIAAAALCWLCICAHCLRKEVIKVYHKLQLHDLDGARKALSMIVGRDTAQMDEKAIIRAAVETTAENLTDGVIAPVFYLALGGAPLGILYKAINTMDSMIGYKNERYINFGRCAAKLDDAATWLPARISGVIIVMAARILGYNAGHAWQIYKRDRLKHESPNSAHAEAAFAGALDIELAGGAVYAGRFEPRPALGDAVKQADAEDIVRAARLMQSSAAIFTLAAAIFSAALHFAVYILCR